MQLCRSLQCHYRCRSTARSPGTKPSARSAPQAPGIEQLHDALGLRDRRGPSLQSGARFVVDGLIVLAAIPVGNIVFKMRAEGLQDRACVGLWPTEYFDQDQGSWRNAKHCEQVWLSLEAYAFPELGTLAVADITRPMVLRLLRAIWGEIPETASRVRGRIKAVLDRAQAYGCRSEGAPNPPAWKGGLAHALPAPRSCIMRPSYSGRVRPHKPSGRA